jgi:[ribosomal protein S5]-alanine N-acetyltransferase
MIETKRLVLIPLTYNQLLKYLKDDNSLEQELGLNSSSRIVSENLKERLTQNILPKVADSSVNYLFVTLWTAINKEQNFMVCDLCFKGEPNPEGEIEIGYGTYPQFQGNGFMKEAIAGLIEWAKTQPKVQSIYAETAKDNVASYTILERNHFLKTGESEMYFEWRLTL